MTVSFSRTALLRGISDVAHELTFKAHCSGW